MVSFTPKENSFGVSWNFCFQSPQHAFPRLKKLLRVPFKQGKHLFQALYNSNPVQLSPLTNCPRSVFNLQIYRLVRMFFPETIQSALKIGQKISKAFQKNCPGFITVARTTAAKQFQFAFFSSIHKGDALNCCRRLSKHARSSDTSLVNRKEAGNIRTKTKVLDRRDFVFKSAAYPSRSSRK